jgi:2-keto-4-pentenoate hydratase
MDPARIQGYAGQLFQAERNRRAIAPLTEQDSSITVDDAYRIQAWNVRTVLAMGHVISGKKIGLTSRGIQQQLGVDEPDYGHLYAAMECRNRRIDTATLIQPKIEGEIAFILKEDLAGDAITREDVLRATDCVLAAFEIVDSRIADWKIKLADTIADNASTGRYVLGDIRLRPGDVDLPRVAMRFFKNRGELIDEALGEAVMGDPCLAVAWLANRLRAYGVSLKAGELVLSGAFTAAAPASRGDSFRAEFSGLGTVEARFV